MAVFTGDNNQEFNKGVMDYLDNIIPNEDDTMIDAEIYKCSIGGGGCHNRVIVDADKGVFPAKKDIMCDTCKDNIKQIKKELTEPKLVHTQPTEKLNTHLDGKEEMFLKEYEEMISKVRKSFLGVPIPKIHPFLMD